MITSDDIKRNIEQVLSVIRGLNSRVKLLAVSKTFDRALVLAAIQAGLNEFGESKIQEAEEKIPAVNALHDNVKWHFIGHLQTNKTAKAVKLFDCIQSIDSLRLAEKVSAAAAGGKPVEALLELKVSAEEAKFGILPDEARAVIEGIKKFPGIRIAGLMTMAPYSDDPESARLYFKKARALFDELKRNSQSGNVAMETLSMGMSGDYRVAIEEGSTMVRIGSGIFGKRSY
jgi:pyridoxal phosphate enzyme (YggS family)